MLKIRSRLHTINASATPRPSCTRREALSVFALALSAFAPIDRISAHPMEPITEWSGLNLPISHYLTLSVSVNGQTMQGVIDSGTTRSIIRHDIALDLALPYIGTELAETFTRQISGSLYRVDKLQVAGIDLGKVFVGAFDTSDLATRTHQNLPIIIGQDILSALDIEADFVGNRIRALSPKSPQVSPAMPAS